MRNSKAKALRREAKQLTAGSPLAPVAYREDKFFKTFMTPTGAMAIEVYTRRLTDSVRKVYKLLKKMEG